MDFLKILFIGLVRMLISRDFYANIYMDFPETSVGVTRSF